MATRFEDFVSKNAVGSVQVTPDVSYDLQEVVNTSYRLYHQQYEEPTDESGLTKIFFNMGWAIYRTILFQSDIDTKDLQIKATNASAVPIAGLLRLAVNNHLKQTGFGRFIDDVRSDMIAFGSAIVKIADGKLHNVDLRNVVRLPHITDIQGGSMAERVWYTYDQVMSLDLKDDARTAVEAMWEKMCDEGQSLFPGYEFWTYDEFGTKDKEGNELKEYTKGCIVYIDNQLAEATDSKQAPDWDPFIEIDRFKTPYKRRRTSKRQQEKLGEWEPIFPYYQVDFIRPKGRWLGIGVFELIAGLQEYYNEKWHLYRKKDILDLRGIFVHKKGMTGASLEQKWLDQLDTGFTVELDQDEDLQRLIVETKTGEFIASIDKIYEMARQIVGVTAQGVGDNLPSTTTATVAVVNQKTQQTTSDYVIQQMGHFLVQVFEETYFETILDELDAQEMVQIVGSPAELAELDEYFVDNLVYRSAEQYKAQNGIYPTEEEVDGERERLMEEQAKLGNMRFAAIKKKIVDTSAYTLEFYVDNERFDKAVQIQNIQAMLQDPNFTGSREKLEETKLDMMGLQGRNYRKTKKEREEALKQQVMDAALQSAGKMGGSPMGPETILPEAQQFGNAVTPGQR